MATLVSRGEDIGFTILPYTYDAPVQQELIAHPSDVVLGYVTYNEETGERKFTYTESGGVTEADVHWSLSILKEFPYCEKSSSWIVYRCAPEETGLAFGNIISKYHQTLHIYNWDIWSVEGKSAKVAVVTSWEAY
jgi:hypothetical protein